MNNKHEKENVIKCIFDRKKTNKWLMLIQGESLMQ